MRIRRKSSSCPNCGYTLDKVYNYCPNCGQDNNDNNVTFSTLVSDFFSTYFSFDSKFAHSFKPFFLRPGRLTLEYVNGKRAHFAHPLRLYLIVSLFYFFVFTLVGKESIKDSNNDNNIVSISGDMDDIGELDDDTKEALVKTLSKKRIRRINRDLEETSLEGLKKSLEENLSDNDKIDLLRVLDSISLRTLGLDTLLKDSIIQIKLATAQRVADKVAMVKDSIRQHQTNEVMSDIDNQDSLKREKKVQEEDTEEDEKDDFILNRIDFEVINKLKDDRKLTDQNVLDSLNIGELTAFEERIVRQTIRVMRSEEEQLAEFILKNLPFMMLLLIPIFALILKILYLRRKELYIKHLIHGFHLHSFAYLFYGVSWLIILYGIEDEDWQGFFAVVSFIVVSTYAFVSFLKVYKQHWFKTFIKFNVVGFVYLFFIFTFFLGELLISMFFY